MLHEGSFFKNILDLAEKYDLPTPNEMKNISKEHWKIMIKIHVGVTGLNNFNGRQERSQRWNVFTWISCIWMLPTQTGTR